MPVTQKLLLSSSCLQQEYHNAPHGAHQIMWLYHYYKNWDFAGLMHAFNAGTAAAWA